MRRYATSLLAVLFGVTAFVGRATAQDISDEKRDEAVDQRTGEEASKRVEEQSERLDEQEEGTQADKRPGYSREDVEADKMSQKEIEKLKRRLEEKNREMIQKLDRLIKQDPYSDQKPQWMFQKAELMWELRNMEYLRKRTEYNQCMEAARQGTTDESECDEPQPNYSDAQTIYKEILEQFPDYKRLDEVIYRLGQGLIEADKGSQAVSYLQRLVEDYPNSKYIPDANLALAEYFFKQELLGAARDKYKKVLEHEDNPNYDYALYKLGWVYYNQNKYRDAIKTFKRVVERTNEELGFQNQAINDLVLAYSEIEGGWKEMRDYFLEIRDRKFTYEKLGKIASLYEGQGKDRPAIQVYQYFIENRPNHKRIPTWMENVIKARKKIGDFEKTEQAINKYVSYLSPNGTWWKKNKGNDGPRNNAELLSQASIAYLANTYHRRGQKHGDAKFYRKAADYYNQYIDRFPNDPASFDMNFFLAEIYLHDLDDYAQSAEYYQKVVDLYQNDNVPEDAKEKEVESMVKDAAYGVVNAYNELVKKHHPDSILVKMAQYEEKNPGETFQAKDKEKGPPSEKDPNERVDLLDYEKGFVKASDQYSEMFPETDITPTVDFVAAEVYKARGHYEECIDRYESIIEHAPDHRYASFAGNSLLEANYVLENWAEVEKWARHLLDNEIFDVTPKESLQSAIAYAINEKSKDLKEEGETDKAADELLRLAEEFPDSELAPGAIFNAAAIYESGDRVKQAVTQYKRVIDKYPESKQAPESLFVLGLIAESRANFGKAASYFERLGTEKTYTIPDEEAEEEDAEIDKKYSDHPKAADAVYNAAELRKAMEQWSNAISTYDQYVEMFPDRDDIREVELELAYLEKRRDEPEKALDRFESFAERDDLEPGEKVEIFTEIGLLIEQTEPDDWKESSDEYFTKAVETWRDELEGETKQEKRHAASRARFRQAERLFQQFDEIELEFPQDKLKERLKEKGEALAKAEKVYETIAFEMKSPRWASAAAFRIGAMYDNFYQSIYDLPLPDGLNERQKMEYRMFLDERAAPVQEKAVARYNAALKVALDLKAYNEWSRKSAKKISELRSAQYPITGQKGVSPDHGQIKFYTPEPLTDRKVAESRLKDRIERMKAEQKQREKKKQKETPDESDDQEDGGGDEEAPAQASAGGE